MRDTTLQHLTCPQRAQQGRCGGTISLVAEARDLPVLRPPAGGGEILEGLLRCAACGTEYPVISGVAIVVHGVADYLTRFWRAVLSAAALHGTVSEGLARWLERHHPDAPGLPSADQRLDVNLPGSMDRLADLAGGDARYGTFAKFLREWQGRSPYDRLASFAQTLGANGGIAIDSGCGAGAMALRLAPTAACVIGVDYAFGAVLLARRLLLHQPHPKVDYELRRSAEACELRSTAPALAASVPGSGPAPPLPNADFLVADSMNLPLADASVDLVAGANIIDILSLRSALKESVRVLRAGGLVLLTDPFRVNPSSFTTEAADPVASLKGFVGGLGLKVEMEEDFVPWVWYLYDRHFQVYLNYCAAARKSA